MDFWRQRSIHTRRRIAALAVVIVAIVVFVVLVVPALPCQFPGGDACAPEDEAADIVPAEALAYAHADLDSESEQYDRAAEYAEKLPLFSGELVSSAIGRLPGGTEITDFEEQVRPWFGGELAFAELLLGTDREQVLLLEAADVEEAAAFAESLATGTAETAEYREVELTEDRRGLASAQVGGFQVLASSAAALRSVIDVAEGAEGAEALADDEIAQEARDELPAERMAEVWMSADGAQRLVGDPRAQLASLAAFVAPGATDGAAVSVGFDESGGAEVAARSLLDAERAEASPAFFGAFESFEPQLPERLAADALGYAGIANAQATAEALLEQAAAQAPGIAAAFEDLVRRLEKRAGTQLEGGLLDALGDETALALVPAASDEDEEDATASEPAVPIAEFVTDGIDEDAAREALAAVQAQADVSQEQRVGDVETRSVQVSPTIELTYAVFDGLVAAATDPAGIEQLATGEGGLEASELYSEATEDLSDSDEVALRVFLDLAELVELGEALGLGEDPQYAPLAGEFRRLEALGLEVRSDSESISTDARLLLGD